MHQNDIAINQNFGQHQIEALHDLANSDYIKAHENINHAYLSSENDVVNSVMCVFCLWFLIKIICKSNIHDDNLIIKKKI